MNASILQGDVLARLAEIQSDSVQCCVTSPPYFGLRDYGVAGQIGLEPTPAEFVAKLVEVFRAVRRVLKDDGTCWVNLGDSYANDGKWGGSTGGKHVTALHGDTGIGRARKTTGMKPKDLMGMPWRVAFALQQPHYAGRIKNEHDRIWLAAMVDGEGCFYVHRRQAGQHAGDGYMRKTDTYSPALEVANTSLAIIERCAAIAGCGSVSRQDKDRRQPLYRWTVRSDEARAIARELHPYLVAKRQQCRIVCGMPNGGDAAEAAWQAMKLLHAGAPTDVDFAAPASLHEPGWYLRQDLIWAKPNPMPESVRDRCTKAHEYVFLLSKSERYFYDVDAIAEPVNGGAHPRAAGNKSHKHAAAFEAGDERARTKAGLVAFAERTRDRYVKAANTEGRMDALVEKRNLRSVWTIGSEPYPEAHFAVFPSELPRRCILAGSRAGDTVLDPFNGSGTTGQVALELGRHYIGIELNPEYVELTNERLRQITIGLPLEAA